MPNPIQLPSKASWKMWHLNITIGGKSSERIPLPLFPVRCLLPLQAILPLVALAVGGGLKLAEEGEKQKDTKLATFRFFLLN